MLLGFNEGLSGEAKQAGGNDDVQRNPVLGLLLAVIIGLFAGYGPRPPPLLNSSAAWIRAGG
jgi:hypothetical protein